MMFCSRLPGGRATISMPLSSRSSSSSSRISAMPPRKSSAEELLELLVDRLEGLAESGFPRSRSISPIVCLRLATESATSARCSMRKAVALVLLFVLVGRQEVDRAQPLEDLAAAGGVGLELGEGLFGGLGQLG